MTAFLQVFNKKKKEKEKETPFLYLLLLLLFFPHRQSGVEIWQESLVFSRTNL
jgi:hypothetical protein